MSFNRLRKTLQSRLEVSIDSSSGLVKRVADLIAARAKELAEKGKSIDAKTPKSVPLLQTVGKFPLRPIDLLKKIGQLTTPTSVNMAKFSASWATRRYFWAIEPGNGALRLSQDARQLDFHQKTLLSDEFGMGMAGLVMDRFFQTDGFADMSAALADPTLGLRHEGEPQPDYLMWDRTKSTYFVVECKGCQTSRSTALNQIRRGMEQVPTVKFKDTNRSTTSLVIATVLDKMFTTVFVLDPPPDDEREFKGESISRRVSDREWLVESEEKLVRRMLNVQRSHLLKWSGQNQAAARIDQELEVQRLPSEELVDADIEIRAVRNERFSGYRSALFPELFGGKVTLFSGVQGDVLDAIRGGSDEMEQAIQQFRKGAMALREIDDPYSSVGLDGTCLQVEGI
jgi:hypothetical protein